MSKRIIFAGFALIALAALVKAEKKNKTEPGVVPSVDLSRYAGRWYEIARFPNRFQTKCADDVTADYALRADGEVDVLNQCRKASGEMTKAEGKARVVNRKGPNTKLEVRFAPSYLSFLPFVWGDYWIIDLAPDYSYAVVGSPDRKYLWVLSRTPRMDESVYAQALSRASAEGFDVNRLVKTEQSGS